MGNAYSMDLRERVVADIDAQMPAAAVARKYRVSQWWIHQLKRRRLATGSIAPAAQGGYKARALADSVDVLEALIEEYRDATLDELRERLRTGGLEVKRTTLWNNLQYIVMSLKKTAHAAEQEREDVRARREDWQAMQPTLDITKLVFLDETGASTQMARRYGRAKRGQRSVAAIAHGHWKTTTFIAGLRHHALTAPMLLDSPMAGAAFLLYVQTFLAPTLSPADLVVADNLPAHKWPASGQPSKPPAPPCSICPPIPWTSTRSKNCSPNSKPCCAKPPHAPSLPCGPPLPNRLKLLLRRNASTTSAVLAMLGINWNML